MSLPARVAATTGAAEFRRFMRRWATGVTVVSTVRDGRPVGCTVNAFTSVSLDPPLLLVSLSNRGSTLAAVEAHGTFAVSVLSWAQRQLVSRFAAADGDRFAGVNHRMQCGVPVIMDVAAATVCTLTQVVPVTDHALVFGCPLWCEQADDRAPVLFLDGRYRNPPP
jgi:flavin reductase (DIM6/NTAB) family NADH-FMN oxidoreductase RutF